VGDDLVIGKLNRVERIHPAETDLVEDLEVGQLLVRPSARAGPVEGMQGNLEAVSAAFELMGVAARNSVVFEDKHASTLLCEVPGGCESTETGTDYHDIELLTHKPSAHCPSILEREAVTAQPVHAQQRLLGPNTRPTRLCDRTEVDLGMNAL